MKLCALLSGGKDSVFASYLYQISGHKISCFLTIKSENQYSWMFHTAKIDFTNIISKITNIDLIEVKTKGEKEEELKDLKKGLKEAIEKYNIEGVITGAIDSDYQRLRIARICEELNLKSFNPLWRKNYYKYFEELMNANFTFTLTKIMAYGIDQKWLGQKINKENYKDLIKELEKNKVNIIFEGGEAETLVLDCPMYNKEIIIEDYNINEVDNYDYDLKINKYSLKEK
jgi:asparagine synthase (glutamine-hydrolysing)